MASVDTWWRRSSFARGDFLRDLGLGRGDDAVRLGLRLGLRLLDRLLPELLTLRDDLARLGAGLADQVGDPLLGVGQALAALLAGGEAVGDLLLARLDRTHQRRPDELGA